MIKKGIHIKDFVLPNENKLLFLDLLKKDKTYAPIKITISEEIKQKAEARFQNVINNSPELMGKMNNDTFMEEGSGTVHGFIGELLFQEVFPKMKFVADSDMGLKGIDFINKNGLTFDVKTKYATMEYTPRGDYLGSITVNSFNKHNPDIYVFARIYRKLKDEINGRKIYDYPHGWLIGWVPAYYMHPDKYGILLLKGEKEGDNGYAVNHNCINIRHDEMYRVKV